MCFGEKITEIIDGGFGSGLLVRNVCVVKVVKFSILCAHVGEKCIVGKDVGGEWALLLSKSKMKKVTSESGGRGGGKRVLGGGEKRMLVDVITRVNLQIN